MKKGHKGLMEGWKWRKKKAKENKKRGEEKKKKRKVELREKLSMVGVSDNKKTLFYPILVSPLMSFLKTTEANSSLQLSW